MVDVRAPTEERIVPLPRIDTHDMRIRPPDPPPYGTPKDEIDDFTPGVEPPYRNISGKLSDFGFTDVRAPDGSIARFPKGMADADIEAVMQREYPAPAASLKTAPPLLERKAPTAADLVAMGGDPRQGLTQELGTAGGRAYDALRLANKGATFGLSDRLTGILGGQGAGAERAKTEQSGANLGSGGTAIEIAASLAPFSAVAKGVGLAAKAVEAVPLLGRVAASPTVQTAATGATAGGLTAIGGERSIGPEAALGAVAGLGGQALGSAIGAGGRAVGLLPKQAAAKSVDELKAAASAEYDKAFKTPVIINQQGLKRLAGEVETALTDFAYHPKQQAALKPAVDEILKMAGPYGGNATLKGLDVTRRLAGNAATNIDASTRTAAHIVTEKIDDFIQGLRPSDVIGDASSATEAVKALKTAQTGWRTMRKTELVQGIIDNAKLAADSAGSGGNINNAIRQGFKNLLKNKKQVRNFSQDERAAFRAISSSTSAPNIARYLGKLGPLGNGLMAVISGYHAAVSPATGIPLAAAGAAAKLYADAATRNRAAKALAMVSSGGTKTPKAPTRDRTVDKLLMSLGIQSEDELLNRSNP